VNFDPLSQEISVLIHLTSPPLLPSISTLAGMFNVKRFDGSSTSESTQSAPSQVTDRLALLNARLESKKSSNPNPASTSNPFSTAASNYNVPSTSNSNFSSAVMPMIHPSRLSAPALRASDKKSKSSSSNSAGKEKTKAKQRYEAAKKTRRKNKEISKKGKKPGEGKQKGKERHVGREEIRENRKREKSASLVEPTTERKVQDNKIFDFQDLKRQREEEGKEIDNGWNGKRFQKNIKKEEVKQVNVPAATTTTAKAQDQEKKVATQKNAESESDSSSDDSRDSSDSDSDSSSSDEEDEVKTPSNQPSSSDKPPDETSQPIISLQESEPEVTAETIGEPIGLSRFPLPRQNFRSDPSILAAQGLSKGLAHPTLVDPSFREKIEGETQKEKARKKKEVNVAEKQVKEQDQDEASSDEEMMEINQDSQPVLNGRAKGLGLVCGPIRKQLSKMGVTEWFAGEYF